MALAAAGEQQFTHMVRQMGKMMDQLQKGYFNFCPAETWTPPVNLYENDTGYIVCVCALRRRKGFKPSLRISHALSFIVPGIAT